MNATLNGTTRTTRTTRTTVKASKASKAPRKLKKGEIIRAGAFFSLACAGLAVSLPHLAHEVMGLTGSAAFAAWFLAIVIDCGMIATKAHLSAHGANRTVAWAIVGACTGVSMILNSHAFLEHAATPFGMVASVGFGMFLPLFILSLSFMGSEILNRRK